MLRERKMRLAARGIPTTSGHPIFPSETGGLRDPSNVQHEWQRVRDALGLPENVTFYSFRKAVATILDDAGISARITADVIQHADPAMTQRKYMARGRVHHIAAAALQHAVTGDTPPDDSRKLLAN